MRVKIIGAGSIGNHMAHASRSLGWSVCLCDIDSAALDRTRTETYPGRYGTWDSDIQLCSTSEAPTGGFDLIVIGTPPDHHLDPALAALREHPRALLIEKPVCPPDLEPAGRLFAAAAETNVATFVGYDHVLGRACVAAESVSDKLGPIATLDVEFREHWGGIFAAHPWLSGPGDSYLGHWPRGGGASGEHSHAINLFQHFARYAGAGNVVEVSAAMSYVSQENADYDEMCALNLRTETGLTGRVIQDVITKPARKWARLQGRDGFVEWHCTPEPGIDAIRWQLGDASPGHQEFPKTRPDDFIAELSHIADVLEPTSPSAAEASPIALSRGLDTLRVIAAAHLSAAERRTVHIDPTAGYSREALV